MPMLTKAIVKQLWPRAPMAKVDAIVRTAPAVFTEFDITEPLVVAHLMAQISHENGAGTIIRENMNYSAERMMEIFGVGRHSAKVTEAEAQRLAHKPKEIAERVYGLGNPKKAQELGNTRPGDGYRFRGNGDLQLTGGDSHRRIGDLIGVDLYGKPEQLENPAISFRCAVAEFVKLNCVKPAMDDNIELVTKRVNGGYNGLAERKVWLRKWKAALADVATPEESDDTLDHDIPPPLEPRGGEADQPKPMAKSKTLWSIILGFITGGAGMVWQAISDNPATVAVVVIGILLFLLIFVGRTRIKQLIEEAIG